MAIVGYARINTIVKLLVVQVDNLNYFRCDKIYLEKRYETTADRPNSYRTKRTGKYIKLHSPRKLNSLIKSDCT